MTCIRVLNVLGDGVKGVGMRGGWAWCLTMCSGLTFWKGKSGYSFFKLFSPNPGDFIFIMGPGPGTHHITRIDLLQMTDILKDNKESKCANR